MTSSPLLLCARQELLLAVRSRWTQIFAVVFAGLSLAVASSGYVLTGGYGVQDFARTAASLVQLVLLLVPLASLLMGALALTPERCASELLFSQPVPRGAILLGKLLGLFAALASALLFEQQCGARRFAGLATRPPGEVVAQGLILLRGAQVLRLALLEGVALFGLVVLFLAAGSGVLWDEPYLLLNGVGTALCLAVGALTFPTEAGVRAFVRQRLEQAQQLPR